MAFKIAERFEVQAPVERVWQYLIDPAMMAQRARKPTEVALIALASDELRASGATLVCGET